MSQALYTYRVNYGNGQVSQNFGSKGECFRHIAAMDQYQDYAFVQFYADGEWFNVGMNGKASVSLW
jgi:hypothetical protein